MACRYQVLDHFSAEEREQLLQGHRVITIPATHQLLFQADWGAETYVLTAGIAKARSLTAEGEEVVISLMGGGSLIGDLALFSPQPIRSLDVVALTPMTVMKLRQGALKEAMDGNSRINHAVACLQAERLVALGSRLMLMQEDATTRLLATLLDLALLSGPEDDPQQVIAAIPQHELARIAGLSRGTTSTLITKLRANGTLEMGASGGLRFASLAPLVRRGLLQKAPT